MGNNGIRRNEESPPCLDVGAIHIVCIVNHARLTHRKSDWIIIPTIGDNEKCLKPPTSIRQRYEHFPSLKPSSRVIFLG